MKTAASATKARIASLINFFITRSLRPNVYQKKMPSTFGKIQNLNCYSVKSSGDARVGEERNFGMTIRFHLSFRGGLAVRNLLFQSNADSQT
jgi:citrate lyase alpha subunit